MNRDDLANLLELLDSDGDEIVSKTGALPDEELPEVLEQVLIVMADSGATPAMREGAIFAAVTIAPRHCMAEQMNSIYDAVDKARAELDSLPQ